MTAPDYMRRHLDDPTPPKVKRQAAAGLAVLAVVVVLAGLLLRTCAPAEPSGSPTPITTEVTP